MLKPANIDFLDAELDAMNAELGLEIDSDNGNSSPFFLPLPEDNYDASPTIVDAKSTSTGASAAHNEHHGRYRCYYFSRHPDASPGPYLD